MQVFEGFTQHPHHRIGMGIGGAEDHGLFVTERIQLQGQLAADDAIEVVIEHAFVEAGDVKVQLVLQLRLADLPRGQVNALYLLTLVEVNSFFGQQRDVADGRFVVNQPVIGHGFAVAVGIKRMPKDVGGVFGRCGRQTDLDRIKVVQHAPVGRQVLRLIAQLQLAFGHFLVQRIPPVRFIHDDAIKGIDRRRVVTAVHTPDHGLHSRYLHTVLSLNGHIPQFGNVVVLGQWHVLLKQHVAEGILRLITQGRAIHQEQNAFETFCFEQSINQTNDGAGFSGPCRHRQQAAAVPVGQALLYGTDGLELVITQAQICRSFLRQLGLRQLDIALQKIQQTLW